MSDGIERRICDDAWSRIRRLTWLMAPAPAIYVVVGYLLLRRGAVGRLSLSNAGIGRLLMFAFATLEAACLIAAVATALRLRRTVPPASLSAAAQRWTAARVLTLALAELPAVLGLADALLSGDLRRLLVPASAAVVVTLFLLPRRAALHAYVRRGGRSGDAPS